MDWKEPTAWDLEQIREYTPEEIRELVNSGNTGSGKAMQLSDGRILTWEVDPHGGPHHAEVEAALGYPAYDDFGLVDWDGSIHWYSNDWRGEDSWEL